MSDGVHFTYFPPYEEMNFAANCTLWGNWLATLLLPNPWDKSDSIGGSYASGILLFLAALPPGGLDEVANLTVGDLAGLISEWFAWNLFDDTQTDPDNPWPPMFTKGLLETPADACPAEYCKAIGYMGNADLTGIGVYVSYYVEAGLATLYLLAFTIWHIGRHVSAKNKRSGRGGGGQDGQARDDNNNPDAGPAAPKRMTFLRRTLDSFRGSLDAFLTSAMLMSIAMLLAALYTSISHGRERASGSAQQTLPFFGSAVYDMVLSLLAATFSVFPVMLLYALMGRREKKEKDPKAGSGEPAAATAVPKWLSTSSSTSSADAHRVWLRRGVMAVLWILAVAEVYLSPRGERDYDDRHNRNQVANQDVCNQRGGTRYWHAMKAAQVLIIGAPVLWLVLTAFVVTGFGIPGLADRPWVRRWRSVWRLGIAWLNLLLMWGLLAYFTVLRHNIIETSGGLDDENKWGFGQLLALATWVPVLAEFLYIFIWGLEESLDTHMPAGFSVTRDFDPGLFHVATLGLDPFNQAGQGQEEPLMGEAKPPGAQSTVVEMVPLHTGYQGGQMAQSVQVVGGAQQAGTHVYYDNPPPGQSQGQSPWHQWNNTGW